MNIILLSGGSGKRLWPLSNDIRSKQFIKIFKKLSSTNSSNVEYESMVQRIFRQIKTVDSTANITIATSKSQVSALRNQLGNNIQLSVEPCRKDTFPAIALATAYLHDVEGISKDDAVVVCPVDPYVDDDYFRCIKKIYNEAKTSHENIVLMGIAPTYPSEKYGYIIPREASDGHIFYDFKEKPDAITASEYIGINALWNGGVFAFKLDYVLKKSEDLLGTCKYKSLLKYYETLKKISFDYAVVEKEKSINVVRYEGTWKDLGTWNTLTEAMEENVIGKAKLTNTCENVHILNELGIPILALGMKDTIISASPDGILVSDKHESSYIKPYVDELNQQIMYAEKSWGSYRVLNVDKESLTVKVTLNPGHKMNYHSHDKRDEIWTVTAGSGIAIIDDVSQYIYPGDVIKMPIGCKHTVVAGNEGLKIIEVQIGDEISVEDKKKYDK